MPRLALSSGPTRHVTTVTITASINNVNLFTLAGSPAAASDFVFVVQSGVTVGSTSSGTPSVDTGTFPVGSTVKLENRGNIYGRGGDGGAGGSGGAGSNGSAGGDAINLGFDITIDNTLGNIFGGGGGGKGGTGDTVKSISVGGGGGGGGQGSNAAVGGSGGYGSAQSGTNGGNGTSAAPGSGGSGGSSGGYTSDGTPGSDGGAWATAVTGALAGKAIKLNSHTVTWLGGNNGSQVKGSVA